MHRRFNEPSNPDVLAFHEAFADLVALFQHFSLPGVLRDQIAGPAATSRARTGWVSSRSSSARRPASAERCATRSARSTRRPASGSAREPDPDDYANLTEPHARGAILVAAVFDAFLTIYKSRVADLLRIATGGTGVLPEGQLHPDLVNRLAEEAAGSAQHVLEMCIRALDYCPPVDITFGDYLRALITADFELDPWTTEHHRVAFVEAFRRRGIVPDKCARCPSTVCSCAPPPTPPTKTRTS